MIKSDWTISCICMDFSDAAMGQHSWTVDKAQTREHLAWHKYTLSPIKTAPVIGISNHTVLNYGLAMTATSFVILMIDLLLREHIVYGTIIDALLTGNIVQLYNNIDPLPENHSMWIGIAAMLIGFVFMALGIWIYYESGTVLWAEGLLARRDR